MLDDAVAGCRTVTAACDETSEGPRVLIMYPARGGAVEQSRVSATPARKAIMHTRNPVR